MAKATIMIGLPGSGKSSFLSTHWLTKEPRTIVCSADTFFEKDGQYNFDPKLLSQAHAACLKKFIAACQAGQEDVAVDNTNLSLSEIAPYIAVATAYGLDIQVIRVETPVSVAMARNVHGVPPGAYVHMEKKELKMLEEWPPFWPRIEYAIEVKGNPREQALAMADNKLEQANTYLTSFGPAGLDSRFTFVFSTEEAACAFMAGMDFVHDATIRFERVGTTVHALDLTDGDGRGIRR
jgi:predicted kinase